MTPSKQRGQRGGAQFVTIIPESDVYRLIGFYGASLAPVRSRRIVAFLRALLARWMARHEKGSDHCHKGPFFCREALFVST